MPYRGDGFQRSLVKLGNRLVVQTVCDYCGVEIVDSVTETLVEREHEHREACHKAKAPATGSEPSE